MEPCSHYDFSHTTARTLVLAPYNKRFSTLPRARAVIDIGIFFAELSEAKSRSDALSSELEGSTKSRLLEAADEVARLKVDLVSKEEDLNQRSEALREKDEEIAKVNKLLDDELQTVKLIQLQKDATVGEIKDVTAERDQALANLQSARGQIDKLQDRLSGLEVEVTNVTKDKEFEAERVASLTNSLEQYAANMQVLEEEKSGLLDQIEEFKQNKLLSDRENRQKVEHEILQQSSASPELEAKIQELNSKVLSTEQNNAMLVGEKETLEAQVVSLSNEMQSQAISFGQHTDAEITSLQSQVNELTELIKSHEEERTENTAATALLESRIQDLNAENKSLQESYDKLMKDRPDDMDTAIIKERDESKKKADQFKEKAAKLLAKCKQQQKEIDEGQKVHDSVSKELSMAKEELESLSKTVGEKEAELESERLMAVEISSLQVTTQSRNNELTELIKSHEEKMSDNEAATALLESRIQDLIEEVKNHEQSATEAVSVKERLTAENRALQESYNKLLNDKPGDETTLIKERDESKKKAGQFKEKATKLLAKCKQQQKEIDEGKKAQESISNDLSKAKEDLESFEEKVREKETELQSAKERVTELESQVDEKDSKVVMLEGEVEKWQTESMEKAEVLEEAERKIEELRDSAPQTPVAGEAMEEALIRVKGLEDSNARLKTERSELYDAQVQLKEEISQLRQDRSKLTKFLDDTRRELGAVKQANIVSQMMESHLLKSVAADDSIETDSVKVEVGSIHGSTVAVSEAEEEGEAAGQAGQGEGAWDNDSQFEGPEDNATERVDAAVAAAPAAAAVAHFGGFGDDNDGWGDGWREGSDAGASQPKEEPKEAAEPTRVLEKEEDGWGDWGDADEAKQPQEEKEAGEGEGWGGWGDDVDGDGDDPPAAAAHQLAAAANLEASGQPKGDWGGWGEDDDGEEEEKRVSKRPKCEEDAWGGWGDEEQEGPAVQIKKEPAESEPISPRLQQPDSLISTASPRMEDDGWGDDGWAGFDQEQLGENLRLTVSSDNNDNEADGLKVARSGGSAEELAKVEAGSKRPPSGKSASARSTVSPQEFNWQGKLLEKESHIESLESDLEAVKAKLKSLEDTLETNEMAREEVQINSRSMEGVVENLTSEVDAKTRIIAEMEEELIAVKGEHSEAEDKLEVSNDMMEDYKKRMESLSNEQKSLQLELTESYNELVSLRPLKDSEAQLKALNEAVSTLKEEKRELESENSKAREELYSSENSLKSIQSQMETLENERTDLGERLSKVTARRDSLDTNLEAAQMALDEKSREMEDLRARNEELEVTFTGLTQRNEELSADLTEKEAEVDNLEARISDLKDMLKDAQENDVDQGLKEHSDNLIKSELEMEVAELQARLQATEQELEGARDGAMRQEMALAELQQQAAEREDRINTAESAVSDAERQKKLVAEECDEISAKLTTLEGRLESVEAERGRIADSVLEKESLIQSLSQEVESLRNLQHQHEQQQQPQQQQQQEQEAQLHPEVGAFGVDVAESNRPPPDVTQGQSSQQPDVAGPSPHFGGQGAPDLMPNAALEQIDLVQSPADFFNQPGPAEGGQNQPGFADYFGASGEGQLFAQPEQQNEPGYFDAFAQPQPDPQPMADEPNQQQQQGVLHLDPEVNLEREADSRDAEIHQQIVAQLERERDELAAKCSTIESRLETVEAERKLMEESVSEKEAKIHSLSHELESLQSVQLQQHQQEEVQGQPEAEAVGVEQGTPPDQAVQEYQAELASYQQAISDWQAWAETQNAEVAALQTSLAEYTEAHALATREVEELRAGSESDTLRAKLRAKELEVTDLSETLDRLRCEKEDLEQEVGELSRRNAEIASSDDSNDVGGVEMAVYEELKASHEDLLSERARVNDDLQDARQENEDLKSEKGRLQAEIEGLNEEVASGGRDIEVKEGRIASLMESRDEDQRKIQELETEKSKLLVQIEELTQKVTESNDERERELASQLENARAELEGLRNEGGDVAQYQAAIAEWQAWHESQTVEFEKLQGSVQQLTMDCQKLEEEKGKLEEEVREKDETLKNRDEEIACVNKHREEELERVKDMRGENQLQQAAIGGEMKEQLMAVTTERDQALNDLQSARGEVVQLQDRQSGLELEVTNISKDKDEEVKRVASLEESIEQLQAHVKELEKTQGDQEKEKESLQEQIEEMKQKQNDLLSDGENQLKEELERVRTEMEALKSKAEDVSQYQTAIADWQAWANTQTTEYAKLQENLQQYTEAYTKAVEENARLLAESQEKDKDIAALKDKSTTEEEEDDDDSPLRRENDRLNARLDIMRSKFSELEASSTELREQLAKAESSLADLSEKNENLTGMLYDFYKWTFSRCLTFLFTFLQRSENC